MMPNPDVLALGEQTIGADADFRVCLTRAEDFRDAGQTAQADAAIHEYLARHQMTAEAAVALAMNAQAATDWDEALKRWRHGRDLFPDAAVFIASEIAVLNVTGRLIEAETLSEEAIALFPNTIDVGAQRLAVLLTQKKWGAAESELDRLSTRFPAHPYLRNNAVRIEQQIRNGLQTAQPDDVLAEALQADKAEDWPAALRFWGILHERKPTDLTYIVRLGNALTRTGKFDEADAVLKAGCEALPDSLEVAGNYAQVAASRPDWPEAAKRWAHILETYPNSEIFWMIAATAYREAGEYEAADQLLQRAIAAEPDRIEFRIHHAVLSDKQEDWATSVKRWDIAHKMRPDEPNIRNSRGDAIWQEAASRLEADNGSGTADSAGEQQKAAENAGSGSAADDEAAAWKQLALQFEGLGDQCEFGIVQRRLGADPIGLFRFAAVSATSMAGLLEDSFDRLGDPEFIELGLTGGDEYLVRDIRGLYHMHCFVRQGSVDETKFLSQQITRLRYLKKKLISDLQDGQKIFVHKSSLERIDDALVCSLHAGLERFGPNVLLVTRQAEAGHQPGTISVLEERILVGYLNTPYGGEEKAIDLDSWRSILKAASAYRNGLENRNPLDQKQEVSETH